MAIKIHPNLTRCVFGAHLCSSCFGHMPHERLIGKPLAFHLDSWTARSQFTLGSGLSYISSPTHYFGRIWRGPNGCSTKGVEGSTYHIIILLLMGPQNIQHERECGWYFNQTHGVGCKLTSLDSRAIFVRTWVTLNGPSKCPFIVFSWIRNRERWFTTTSHKTKVHMNGQFWALAALNMLERKENHGVFHKVAICLRRLM